VGTVEGNFFIAGGIVRESPERQRLHGIAHNHLLHDGMSSVMQSAESRWIDNENIKEEPMLCSGTEHTKQEIVISI
jgi:hypothetical protein